MQRFLPEKRITMQYVIYACSQICVQCPMLLLLRRIMLKSCFLRSFLKLKAHHCRRSSPLPEIALPQARHALPEAEPHLLSGEGDDATSNKGGARNLCITLTRKMVYIYVPRPHVEWQKSKRGPWANTKCPMGTTLSYTL